MYLLYACLLATAIRAGQDADCTGNPRLTLVDHQADIDILGIVCDMTTRRWYRYEGDAGGLVSIEIDGADAPFLESVSAVSKAGSLIAVAAVTAEGGLAVLLPGAALAHDDTLEISLRFVRRLARVDGAYAVVYPTLDGPGEVRVGQQPAAPGWAPSSVRAVICGGLPVIDVVCLSHRADIWQESESVVHVMPAIDDGNSRERDVDIRFTIDGDSAIPTVDSFETPSGAELFVVEDARR